MADTLVTQPALIVFREKDDKSLEAGWFTEADAACAKAARSKPGLTTMENLSDRVRELAARLPAGRFESDGKLLLGGIDRATINELLALRSDERMAAANVRAHDVLHCMDDQYQSPIGMEGSEMVATAFYFARRFKLERTFLRYCLTTECPEPPVVILMPA